MSFMHSRRCHKTGSPADRASSIARPSSSSRPRQKRVRAASLFADFAELSGNEPESGFMRLAMARRAHGEMAPGANVIGALECIAACDLIDRRLPARVEDAICGTQIFFRCAMTIETPLHVERCDAPRQGHDVDRTVARRAAHTLVDVDTVIEIDEIGQVVNARPVKSGTGGLSVDECLKHLRISE